MTGCTTRRPGNYARSLGAAAPRAIFGVLLLLLCGAGAGAAASEGGPDAGGPGAERAEVEVDRLSLAALLIRDGFYDRAESVLMEVDPAEEGLDLARYHTLKGLVFLQRRMYGEAREAFVQAERAGQADPLLSLYLAQAHFGLQEYPAAIQALDRAGETAAALPGAHMLRIQSLWNLGRKSETFDALDRAQARFPDEPGFTQRRLVYLVDLGLFQETIEEGLLYLEAIHAAPDDYVVLGESLRQGKQFDKAATLLEAARLRTPTHPRVLVALAHVYLDDGQPRTAARILEEAAREDPKYVSEAAELYRRAGDLDRALYLNREVQDPAVKTRQRLGLLLQTERFEEALALEDRAARLGLLQDDTIRYALAYVNFQTGRYPRARSLLRQVKKPELFHAASDLIRTIDVCEQSGWQCL